MTTLFQNGAQVETSLFGYESAIGVSGLMGVRKSLNNIFVQLAGHGYSSPFQAARAEFLRNGIFQRLLLRYVQAQLTLSTQNAACNAMHTYEQRLARWLLICRDRARREHLEMAQEFVAQCGQHPVHRLDRCCSLESQRSDRLSSRGFTDPQCRKTRGGGLRVIPGRRRHLEDLAQFDTGFIT